MHSYRVGVNSDRMCARQDALDSRQSYARFGYIRATICSVVSTDPAARILQRIVHAHRRKESSAFRITAQRYARRSRRRNDAETERICPNTQQWHTLTFAPHARIALRRRTQRPAGFERSHCKSVTLQIRTSTALFDVCIRLRARWSREDR